MKKLFYTLILCFFALNISAQVYFVTNKQVSNIYGGRSEAKYEVFTETASGYTYAYKIDYNSLEDTYLSIEFTNGQYCDGEISNNWIYTDATSFGNLVLSQISPVENFTISVTLADKATNATPINTKVLSYITTDASSYTTSTSGRTKTFTICKYFFDGLITIKAPKYLTTAFDKDPDPTEISYNIINNKNHNININASYSSGSGGYYRLTFTENHNLVVSKTSTEARAINTEYFSATLGSIEYSITYTNSQVADWIWISSPFDAYITVKTTNGVSLPLTYTNDPNQNYKNPCFLLRKFDSNKRAQGMVSYWTEVKQTQISAGEGYLLGIDPRSLSGNFIVTYKSINSTNENTSIQRYFSASSTITDYSNQHFIGTGTYFPAKIRNQSANSNSNVYVAKQKGADFEYFVSFNTLSSKTLEPFTPFFIKFESGSLLFEKNSTSINAPAARIQDKSNSTLETYAINIIGAEWNGETTILVNPNKPENENGFTYFTENTSGTPLANQFYSLRNENPHAFNYQLKENQTIQLGGCLQKAGEYSISLNCINTSASSVVLTDNINNTTTELTTDDYTFSATEGENLAGRFSLTLTFAPETTTDLYVSQANQIIVFGNAQNCNITNLTVGENVVIYDATGRLVYSEIANSDNININIPAGTYIVRQTNKTARFAIK